MLNTNFPRKTLGHHEEEMKPHVLTLIIRKAFLCGHWEVACLLSPFRYVRDVESCEGSSIILHGNPTTESVQVQVLSCPISVHIGRGSHPSSLGSAKTPLMPPPSTRRADV